ncbi:hypothetical protein HN924_03090 [Candidatus Woesearchaeota archaeon]|jgi:hypothetical protein|nr:hypothetical protein [Candidatus Woesearchaeota archaeon]MBT7062928.1 hypothetical protein [Candidatus Woesearchaeota archaeon]MBT7402636.1 hypothetical protein [Candidatus Woesearchaeota archaeon]
MEVLIEFEEPQYMAKTGWDVLKKRQDVFIKRSIPSDTLTVERRGKHSFKVNGQSISDINQFIEGYARKFAQVPTNVLSEPGIDLAGLVSPTETTVLVEETDIWYRFAEVEHARTSNKMREMVHLTNSNGRTTNIVEYNLANDAAYLLTWEIAGEGEFGRYDPVTVKIEIKGFDEGKVNALAKGLRENLHDIHDVCTMDDEEYWMSRPYLNDKTRALQQKAFDNERAAESA